MKLKISIIIILVHFIGLHLNAQNNTSSPYSMFGLGDIEARTSIRSNGMGGAGIALESKGVMNYLNPASYAGLDSMFFLFEIGGMGKFTTLKTNYKEEKVNDGNISAINFGFRAKKWWALSFGLMPYSIIGYRIDNDRIIEGTNLSYLNTMEGSGGINQAYIGNAFKIKNFSFGFNTSLLFGNLVIKESNQVALTGEVYDLQTESSYFLSNLYLDYGVQYHFKIKKLIYAIGATFSNKQQLNSSFSNSTYLSTGEVLSSEENSAKDIIIPQSMGVGISVEIPDRLVVAADYVIQDWTENTFASSIASFKNSQSIKIGIEYKPNRSFGKSYFNFVDYRIGAFYSDLYYQLYGIPIIEKGVSIGFGLPFRGVKIDMSLEYGIKGTTQNGLVEENYFKLKLGLSLKQLWFQKRKFH